MHELVGKRRSVDNTAVVFDCDSRFDRFFAEQISSRYFYSSQAEKYQIWSILFRNWESSAFEYKFRSLLRLSCPSFVGNITPYSNLKFYLYFLDRAKNSPISPTKVSVHVTTPGAKISAPRSTAAPQFASIITTC